MSAVERQLKKAYRIARGAQLIAEQIHADAGEIVRMLPLDPVNRMYALEILRQEGCRRARAEARCASAP